MIVKLKWIGGHEKYHVLDSHCKSLSNDWKYIVLYQKGIKYFYLPKDSTIEHNMADIILWLGAVHICMSLQVRCHHCCVL